MVQTSSIMTRNLVGLGLEMVLVSMDGEGVQFFCPARVINGIPVKIEFGT